MFVVLHWWSCRNAQDLCWLESFLLFVFCSLPRTKLLLQLVNHSGFTVSCSEQNKRVIYVDFLSGPQNNVVTTGTEMGGGWLKMVCRCGKAVVGDLK